MNIMNKTVSEYTKRDAMVNILADVRATGGRIFFLGVGGSAGNCGHAVNDFRKIAGIESYAPTDNVSELTARTNDDGWETVFASYLKVSKIGPKDVAFVFSVGGGNREKNIRPRRLVLASSVSWVVTAVIPSRSPTPASSFPR
jgi:D-sedoheptulose 7-phosphate isomerase